MRTRIPLSTVMELIQTLNPDVEAEHVKAVHIDPIGIQLTLYRFDEHGHKIACGMNEVATTTITYAIDTDA